MKLQDRVEMHEESGFIQTISPEVARRQLKISLAVVAALAVATLSLASIGQIQPRHSEPATVQLVVQAPGSLQVQQATATKNKTQPGG